MGCRVNQRSLLGFVIQGGIEVGALLQVFLGVGAGAGFFAGQFHTGGRWQGHCGGNGGSGDDREEIEVHVGNPCVRLVEWPGKALEPNLRPRAEP